MNKLIAFGLAALVSTGAIADKYEWSYLDGSPEVYLWNWKCKGIRLVPSGDYLSGPGFKARVDEGPTRKGGYLNGILLDPNNPLDFGFTDQLMNGDTLYIRLDRAGSEVKAYSLDGFRVAYNEQKALCAGKHKAQWNGE